MLEHAAHLIVVFWTFISSCRKTMVNSASVFPSLSSSPHLLPEGLIYWISCCFSLCCSMAGLLSLPCWVPRCSEPSDFFLQTHHFSPATLVPKALFPPSAVLEPPTPMGIHIRKTRPSQAPPGPLTYLFISWHSYTSILGGKCVSAFTLSSFLPMWYHYVQYRRKFLCSD